MRSALVSFMGVVGLLTAPVWAQDGNPQAGPDGFTFKRMGAPGSGSTRRITVQIDPAEQARQREAYRLAAEARAAAVADEEGQPEADEVVVDVVAKPKPLPYQWFWNEVSPDYSEAGHANVARAVALMDKQTEVEAPRLQDLQDIARAHGPQILLSTIGTSVSPALVLAMISVESGGRPTAVSDKGAQGLMQLIPATAERFGVEDSTDPAQNIKGGVAYLGWLMQEFERDAILALAAYNAGENSIADHEGVPPYPETRAYVPKVLNAWRVARGLCLTPPVLLTDGCVFAVNGT